MGNTSSPFLFRLLQDHLQRSRPFRLLFLNVWTCTNSPSPSQTTGTRETTDDRWWGPLRHWPSNPYLRSPNQNKPRSLSPTRYLVTKKATGIGQNPLPVNRHVSRCWVKELLEQLWSQPRIVLGHTTSYSLASTCSHGHRRGYCKPRTLTDEWRSRHNGPRVCSTKTSLTVTYQNPSSANAAQFSRALVRTQASCISHAFRGMQHTKGGVVPAPSTHLRFEVGVLGFFVKPAVLRQVLVQLRPQANVPAA